MESVYLVAKRLEQLTKMVVAYIKKNVQRSKLAHLSQTGLVGRVNTKNRML